MIKLSQALPDPNTIDWSNPQAIKDWCLQVYLCIEELSRKGKSIQTEVKTSVPTVTTDFEVEGEDIRCSADNKTYTLFNGSIKSHAET